MENIHLIGAEQVSNAARTISAAASDMQRAAASFEDSITRLERALENHAQIMQDIYVRNLGKETLT